MRMKKPLIKHQAGQAYYETLTSLTVVLVFLAGAQYLWRSAEMAQMAVDGLRFAAWERTVWEPSDNDTEVFALHKKDEQLAKDVVMRQLSTPSAWRTFRANLSSAGVPATGSSTERFNLLHQSAKKFVATTGDPLDMVAVTTESGWGELIPEGLSELRGGDPTLGYVTSLNLDKKTWRTVTMKLKSDYIISIYRSHFFWKPKEEVTEKKFALITNSWAASPPVSFVRDRQLMPFSTSDSVSGFKGNNIGNYAKYFWDAVGGSNGFGGQYLARQIGVNASQTTDLAYLAAQRQDFDWSQAFDLSLTDPGFNFDWFNPAASTGLMPQTQQSEFFNPNAVSQWHHKDTFVIAEDKDYYGEPGKKAANSNIGKRKYRAISGQNPVDTYFTR